MLTSVHLGIYRFSGDPEALLAAYDRLMEAMPPATPPWVHVCVVESDGITIYDTCPSEDIFRAFSTSEGFREALATAELPQPLVTSAAVHNARTAGV